MWNMFGSVVVNPLKVSCRNRTDTSALKQRVLLLCLDAVHKAVGWETLVWWLKNARCKEMWLSCMIFIAIYVLILRFTCSGYTNILVLFVLFSRDGPTSIPQETPKRHILIMWALFYTGLFPLCVFRMYNMNLTGGPMSAMARTFVLSGRREINWHAGYLTSFL